MEIFHQLKSDALRTFLSLAGVSVGIFVVIVSLVLVDAFQSAVVAGFDHFGSDMVMVERFPVVSEEGDDAWRSYAARPMPSYADFQALSGGLTVSLEASDREGRRSGGSLCAGESAAAAGSQSGGLQSAGAAGSQSGALRSAGAGGSSQYSLQSAAAAGKKYAAAGSAASAEGWTALGASSEADAIYGGKILRDANLVGVCGAWRNMVYSDILWGRDFSQAELSGGDSKVILGARAAEELFGADLDGGDPAQVCGESIRVGGRNLTVVGVLTREGKNIINLYATDYSLVVPYSTAEAIAGRDALETMIAIGPGAGGRDAALGESRRILRAVRGLRSSSEDNFALNTMEDLCRETVALTGKISLIGVALALFALLIGGFGIVNIMLVSVKERTPVIGLKMALGATRRRILREFLCEAVLLSTLGAALGLLLAAALVALIPSGAIEARIHPHHIAEAFAIALALGLVSGLAPAAAASRLNPVEALRS